MTLLAPFEVNRDKDIQDFNYEVDALEDEHVRREVHTTKVVADDDNDNTVKQEIGDKNYTEVINKSNNKRARKARNRTNIPQNPPPQLIPPINQKVEERSLPTNTIKKKREAKKSFDFYNGDDKSDHHSESPFSSTQQKFMPTVIRSPTIPQKQQKQPLLFSQIGAKMAKNDDKIQDSNSYPFGNSNNTLPPVIPAPFNNRPKPSIESLGHGMGAFENLDEGLPFASREFLEKNTDANNDQRFSFKPFNPFTSGEFARSFEPNPEIPRNLIHPTPKYQQK